MKNDMKKAQEFWRAHREELDQVIHSMSLDDRLLFCGKMCGEDQCDLVTEAIKSISIAICCIPKQAEHHKHTGLNDRLDLVKIMVDVTQTLSVLRELNHPLVVEADLLSQLPEDKFFLE